MVEQMSASPKPSAETYLDQDALYYPYIHIRDVNWLRRTLLLFPHVARIVPAGLKPADNPAVQKFIKAQGGRGELLRRANVYSNRVEQEKDKLRRRFENEIAQDLKGLQRRFGLEATTKAKRGNAFGTQIHLEKAADIINLLKKNGLAW